MKTSFGLPNLTAIVIMGGGAAVSLATPALWHWQAQGNLLNGEATLAFEKRFDEGLSIRDVSISFWANVQYFVFGEGRTGVLVGDNDWLFTTEEFDQPTGGNAETLAKIDLIKRMDGELSARGSELVVALLPDKSRLYPEFLGRYVRPARVEARYADFHAALDAAGVRAPDILAALQAAQAEQAVFLRTDTHWTVAGANAAAATIAAALEQTAWDSEPVALTTVAKDQIQHPGDLLKFLPLGPLAPFGPPPDTIVEQITSAPAGDDLGFFDEVTIEVALVGTSYSADARWNFAGALAEHLQREVLNMALEGRGPVIPMLEYLDSDEFKNLPPKVVIWEIPERFLPVVYQDENEVLP